MKVKNMKELLAAKGMDPEMDLFLWGKAMDKWADVTVRYYTLKTPSRTINDSARIVRDGDSVLIEGAMHEETVKFLQFEGFNRGPKNDWTLEIYEKKLEAYVACHSLKGRIRYERHGDVIEVGYFEYIAPVLQSHHWETVPRRAHDEIVAVGVSAFGADHDYRHDFPFESDDFESDCQCIVCEEDEEDEEKHS